MFDLVIDLVVWCRRIVISLKNDLCTFLYMCDFKISIILGVNLITHNKVLKLLVIP